MARADGGAQLAVSTMCHVFLMHMVKSGGAPRVPRRPSLSSPELQVERAPESTPAPHHHVTRVHHRGMPCRGERRAGGRVRKRRGAEIVKPLSALLAQ